MNDDVDLDEFLAELDDVDLDAGLAALDRLAEQNERELAATLAALDAEPPLTLDALPLPPPLDLDDDPAAGACAQPVLSVEQIRVGRTVCQLALALDALGDAKGRRAVWSMARRRWSWIFPTLAPGAQ